MAKVALIRPPSIVSVGSFSGFITPPIGLAYIAASFCENISSRWLLFYNWAGYFLFYASNYIFRPIRLYKTIKNVITNKHESRGEMALAQIIKRFYFVFKSLKKDKLQRQN